MSSRPWNIGRLDSLLQATLLLRLSELGRARDYYYELLDRVDAEGKRLDAFTFGIFDALLRANGASLDMLPLLLYLLKLSENGAGVDTVDAADHAFSGSQCPEMNVYVELGRYTALRALDGKPPQPGGYAELLLGELTRN